MAQPHKGDRKQYASRVPAAVGQRLEADAQQRGATYSELIAAIVSEHYEMAAMAPMPASLPLTYTHDEPRRNLSA